MSRNLCTSYCCGKAVRLSDLRGKPVEFRRHGPYRPQIGTRWDCPTCGTAYFAIFRGVDKYDGRPDEPGRFVIDLSFYESYNDEHDYADDGTVEQPDVPRHLCTDDAEDVQWLWGHP